jgi:hypothetical protein
MLPYDHVLNGINALNELRRRELHDYERPLAILAYQQAELNRDKKKNKRPHEISDFYIYSDYQISNLPSARYGSAFKELIRMGLCPNWALFVYKDLINTSNSGIIPDEIALISDDCIILAPSYDEHECRGMMIGMESASGRVIEFKSTNGNTILLKVPQINTKVIADEEAVLRIYR